MKSVTPRPGKSPVTDDLELKFKEAGLSAKDFVEGPMAAKISSVAEPQVVSKENLA